MVKTHEKSRIYAVVGTDNVKNIEKVVLQMEATGQISGGETGMTVKHEEKPRKAITK